MIKKVIIVLLLTLISFFMVMFAFSIKTRIVEKKPMQLILKYKLHVNTLYSHRGLNSTNNIIGKLEGENSISSFILAGKNGYQYLETDIYESKDGKFYCIHDNNTGRFSSQNISILESNSQEISLIKLDKIIKNKSVDNEFIGVVENIPSLENYLKICKKYNMVPLIEIKTLQNNTTSVDNTIKLVNRYTDKFIIFSFNLSYVLRAKKYNKNLLVYYLTPYEDNITEDVVDLYASKGIGVAPYIKRINKDICEYAYNKGYPMIIWSIDDKQQYINEYKNWKVWMFGTNSILPKEL